MSQFFVNSSAAPLPPQVVETLTGNTGVATSSANNINVVTANATVQFSGAGSTLTQDFGITNLLLGVSGSSITSGTQNASVGFYSLHNLTSGEENTALGVTAGENLNTGFSNVLIGSGCASDLLNGSGNVIIGQGAATTVTSASNNIIIGYQAGIGYSNNENSNILLSNRGIGGESHVIRIGTQGSGNLQQTQCYLAGVLNTVSGRVVNTTSPGAYPYTTLTTDYIVLVNTGSARTINLVANPVTGTTYRIKDSTGSAAANNITITPASGNIDGSATYVISANYASVDVVYTGSQWQIF